VQIGRVEFEKGCRTTNELNKSEQEKYEKEISYLQEKLKEDGKMVDSDMSQLNKQERDGFGMHKKMLDEKVIF
jgi:hypothetical protein